jgi:hypothetical protein
VVVDGALIFVEGVVMAPGKELYGVIDRVPLEHSDACVFQHFAKELVGEFLAEKSVIVYIVDHPCHCKLDVSDFRDERVYY